MAEDTVKVKKVEGMRLFPCHSVPYFSNNVGKWTMLLDGEIVEIPATLYYDLAHKKVLQVVQMKPAERKVVTPKTKSRTVRRSGLSTGKVKESENG
tara:strand:+ start:1594 stop:1881 length:288 start_codon:yes stop_codon:yes gene_type:complete